MTTVVASQIAAVISAAGGGLLFVLLDTPELRREIAASGGLDEVFFLPFMMILPAVILGTLGGAVGSLGRRLLRIAE